MTFGFMCFSPVQQSTVLTKKHFPWQSQSLKNLQWGDLGCWVRKILEEGKVPPSILA